MTLPAQSDPALDAVPGLVHRFYGRQGGGSRDDFASLNLSDMVGDDGESVAGNWSAVGGDLGLPVARMRQVHGRAIATAHRDRLAVGEADGMVTADDGVALAVLTADCVPILMAAPRYRVVMALHAGWRGTAAGIAAAAVERARLEWGVPCGEWLAALGPSIGPCCYEVGLEVGAQITERWGAMPEAWSPGAEKGHLDLRLANRAILLGAGVAAGCVHFVGGCTACAPDLYFSHRQAKGRTGRQLSAIGWRAGAQRTA